ncbi:MAG: hypothetical protein JNJ57_00405 [Saprospiraceae bacterium]|nr:hypothetical protein [Saprospiraceae bacterium]
MNKSKLARFLDTFSKEDWRALAQFTENPFFNQRSEAISLLHILQKSRSQGKPYPDKEKVFQQIFGVGPYDDQRVRMAMSALLQTAEKYLAVRDFIQDKPAYQFRLCRTLRQRNLHTAASETWLDGANDLKNRPWRNAEYHYEWYKFQEEKYRAIHQLPEVETMAIQPLSDQLDVAFLSRKLWQCCFLLAHQARYNTACNFGFLDSILPYAEKYLHLPAVSIYYRCYLALTQPGENQHFQLFKNELFENDTLFPPEELQDLYILAINFCTRRYNEGDLRFLHDQFDLYKRGFDKNYFLSEGVLSRFTYLNAATIGLNVQDFEWVEKFITEYTQHLDIQHRESLFAFNMARLEYQKSNLGDALFLLQRAEYKETMLALAAKTLQLKIYYELEEFDLLESHLQATAAFIRRKKIMGYHRDNYINLMHIVHKIMQMDRSDRQTLRQTIHETKPLAEKEWLLSRLGDF